jgi:dynein heavy chain
LRTELDQLTTSWAKYEFEVVPHQRDGQDRDAFKLAGLEQVQALLDDSMQIAGLITGSRYAKRLQPGAQEEQDRLNLISDTLEQWRECQRNWLYLENIFSSPDICKARPDDAREYDGVNKAWVRLMKQTHARRSVRQQCAQASRYHELVSWNRTMERVQKNLEGYLEEKRLAFPRFYFISNDELLQILA